MIENCEKYINLNCLPKRNNGSIDWKQSVGINIDFTYCGTEGAVTIIGLPNRSNVEIELKTSTKTVSGKVSRENFKKCVFGNLLRAKIIETDSWMIQYMCDKNDAKKYSKQSNQYIQTQCPYCKYKKLMCISNLYQYGFSCPRCSDGVSYPNKFMFNLLSQLNIKFKNEVSKKDIGFDWVKNYRYDFYFESNNQKYFVEMDGGYHIYEGIKDTDIIKDKLAKDHDIKVIRINCMYHSLNRLSHVKSNILLSELPIILNFNEQDIDWNKCHLYSTGSLVIQICNLWNSGIHNVKMISQILHLSRTTVRQYLQESSENGLCDYNANYRRKHITSNREINVYKKNEFCGTFYSMKELSSKSESLFGIYLCKCIISDCCHHKRDTYKGYTFVFSDEDNNIKLL